MDENWWDDRTMPNDTGPDWWRDDKGVLHQIVYVDETDVAVTLGPAAVGGVMLLNGAQVEILEVTGDRARCSVLTRDQYLEKFPRG